jgi:hypothetical protein
MKNTVCAALLLMVGHALAATPVQWSSTLKLASRSDIPAMLDKAPKSRGHDVVIQMSKGYTGTIDQVKSCNAYFKAKATGLTPTNNASMAEASFYVRYCEPLKALQTAVPAKVNYLIHFSLDNDVGLIPANVIFPSFSGHGPAGTLAHAFPNMKVSALKAGAVSLETKTRTAIITPLARGDFNGQGALQILLNVADYAKTGSFHFYTNVLIGRSKQNGAIQARVLNKK